MYTCYIKLIKKNSVFTAVLRFNQYFKKCLLCVCSFTQSCPIVCKEFSRKEYLSGLPFPSPGDRPNPVIKPVSLAAPTLAGRFFTIAPPRKPQK